jgi:hypothetical protein
LVMDSSTLEIGSPNGELDGLEQSLLASIPLIRRARRECFVARGRAERAQPNEKASPGVRTTETMKQAGDVAQSHRFASAPVRSAVRRAFERSACFRFAPRACVGGATTFAMLPTNLSGFPHGLSGHSRPAKCATMAAGAPAEFDPLKDSAWPV